MQNQLLNGFWQFRQAGTQDWLPASVPGGVHTDLMAAGKLPDPFCGTNEEQAQWVAEKNWEYRRFFYPTPLMLRQERIWLVCDGLDTLAEVRLNGKILGQADNMFRAWRWDVKALLVEGENRLEILFRSPLAYIRARERVRGRGSDLSMGIRGGPHLRKTASHFGWDWGPRLPCIGIWQEIRLEGSTRGRLGDMRFDQEHAPGVVTLTARIQCELWNQATSLGATSLGATSLGATSLGATSLGATSLGATSLGATASGEERHTLRLRITGPDRQVYLLDAPARPQSNMTVTIPGPRLWWPNGYGEPELYKVEVELLGSQDELIDLKEFHLGLRTIELRQVEDSAQTAGAKPAGSTGPLPLPGKSFTFVVNGLPIFCKGSNWIPVDSFPTRVTPEQVENLVSAAAEANHNMLRVWGGGYYESDIFYDLCDRYGILVWQDFQFACATYPLDDPAYLENVRCEVIENVRRLRYHASLALWCGNNEIEMLGLPMGWFKKAAQKEAYERFFFHQLPDLLAVEDPQRPYWPGSPTSNDPFNRPNSEETGDAHLWKVFAEFRPPSLYRQQNPRFVSEFGFQSLPGMQTIQKFALDEKCNFDSAVMRCHQRALGGNPRLKWYLAQRFRLPRTLEGLSYLSQVLQAEAIRMGVEHWRRHPERTSGTLYWQLNDCWPVISWSSIDYFGEWKALHYAARRFYAPLLLSIEDQVEKGQRKMNVWISNDTCAGWQGRGAAWEGRVHWALETLDGEVIEGGDQPVISEPQSAACLLKLDFARHNGKVDWKRAVFIAELWQGNERQALQVAAFVPELRMPLVDPGLHAEIHESGELLVIRVQAKKLARFVELSLAGANVQFSDNFFDLPAGRMETVECELPPGWTLEQARAALRVRSLAEMGPYDSVVTSHWKGDLALISSLWDMAWKGLIRPLVKR